MKQILFVLLIASGLTSCNVSSHVPAQNSYLTGMAYGVALDEEPITESLFIDKESKISEENIKKILDGNFSLPGKMRVAVVNLENSQYRRSRWNDEDYLNSRQKYLETLTQNLESHPRIEAITLVPSMLLSASPSFTEIREAGVRLRADVVLVYGITGGMYQNYKVFKANEYKAFATAQIMLIDTRTGLIPFTEVVTKDYLSGKQKDDFNEDEAEKRTQEESVILALNDICKALNTYLNKE